MGDVYARSVSDQGYRSAVDAIVAANPRPSVPGGIVPAEADVLLEQPTVYGRASHVRRQLEAWDGVVDVVMIVLVPAVPWDSIEATIRTAAP